MVQKADKLPKNFFRTWRYLLFWVSSLLSNMGTWMQQIAQPWVVLSLSNSPFWVGLDSFALNIPGLLFTIWGGILADRFDRKKVVLFFQAIQFICVLILVILLATGLLKVWMIVTISFLVGLTDALSNPAFQTIIPSLVNQKDIPHAVSLNSTQFNLSRILGPAIAGVVIVRFGAISCFSTNAASYVPYFLAIFFIYPRKMAKITREPIQVKPIDQLREIRKLLLVKEIRLPLMITLVTNLFCGPIVTFCPVLIKNVFHAEVGSFGWAMAAFGLGGLMGAGASFISLPQSFSRSKFAGVTAVLMAFVVIVIGLNHLLQLLTLLLVIAGAALTVTNISVNTFLQENADSNFRGRIASLYQLALFGGISIGALVTGFAVSQFNISAALIFNGTVAFLLQAWLFWKQFKKPVSKNI